MKRDDESKSLEKNNPYYGLEDHLKSFRDTPMYEKLCCSWEVDKQNYIKKTSATSIRFPHYSDHGESHSQSILHSIEYLLGQKRIRQLSVSDTWLILQCAYAHDIGMSMSAEDLIEKLAKEPDFYKTIQDICRKDDSLWDAFEYIQPLLDYYKLKNDNAQISESQFIRETTITKQIDAKAQYQIFQKKGFETWPFKLINAFSVIIENLVRPRHGELSEKMILKEESIVTECGIVPIRLRYLVAKISAFHTKGREDLFQIFPQETIGICNDYIHPRFAAVLLRLGDLLDMDNGRFNQSQIEILGNMPYVSIAHQFKHEAITHFLITPLEISVKADFRTEVAKKLLHNSPSEPTTMEQNKLCMNSCKALYEWLMMLKDELEYLSVNWLSIVPRKFEGSCPAFLSPELYIDGRRIYDHELNLCYKITTKRSSEIIEGSGLYKHPQFTFLREVLQNAIDATKIQLYRDILSGLYPGFLDGSGRINKEHIQMLSPVCFAECMGSSIDLYRIEYHVSPDPNLKTIHISIRDYGIGITYDTLTGMLKIGDSQKSLTDPVLEKMPKWLKPTGSFGIGLQSVFYVTKSFRILSRPRYEKNHANPPLREMKFYSTRLGGEIETYIEDGKKASEFGYGTEVNIDIQFQDHADKLLLYVDQLQSDSFDIFCDEMEQVCALYRNYIERIYNTNIISLKYSTELKNNRNSSVLSNCFYKTSFPSINQYRLSESFGRFCILGNQSIIKECRAEKGISQFLWDEPNNGFTFWCEKHKILIRYKNILFNHEESNSHAILFYKGILVDDPSLRFCNLIPFFETEIHLFYEDASSILDISRDRFLPEKIKYLLQDIYSVHFCCLKYLFSGHSMETQRILSMIWAPKRKESISPSLDPLLLRFYHEIFMQMISNKEPADIILKEAIIKELKEKAYLPINSNSFEYAEIYNSFFCFRKIKDTSEASAFINLISNHEERFWFANPESLPKGDFPLEFIAINHGELPIFVIYDYFYEYPQLAATHFSLFYISGWNEPILLYKLGTRNGDYVNTDEKTYWKYCIDLYNATKQRRDLKLTQEKYRPVFPSNPHFGSICVSKLTIGIEHKETIKFNSYIISPLTLQSLNNLVDDWSIYTSDRTTDSTKDSEAFLEEKFSSAWIQKHSTLVQHIVNNTTKQNASFSCSNEQNKLNIFGTYKAFLKAFLSNLIDES